MHDSKLIQLLKKLDGPLLQRLDLFLHSPYFTRSSDIPLFYEHLLRFAPDFDQPGLDRQSLLRECAVLDPSAPARLNYLANSLLRLTEQFLALEEMDRSSVPVELWKLRVLSRLDLPVHFRSTYRKLEKQLQQLQPDPNWLEYRADLAAIDLAYSQDHSRGFRQELQRASDELDLSYLVRKSRYAMEMETSRRVLDLSYEYHLDLDSLLSNLEKNQDRHPFISLYFHAISLIKDTKNEAAFSKLRQLLPQLEGRLPLSELLDHYRNLLNYCTRQINLENALSYHREVLTINRYLLEKGWLYEQDVLPPWRYTNIVTAGLRAGEHEWTKLFIEDQKDRLPESYRENLYTYNKGHYLYETGQAGEAQRLLNQVNPSDLLLSIATRNLLCKIYYEQSETELLLQALENYRIYLLRHEETPRALLPRVKGFLHYLKRLADLRPPFRENLLAIQDDISEEKDILERAWLVRMIERAIG